MSHGHERAEKVCLNCGANLHGRYCHVCGQENVEPKESLGQLLRHFFEDITHFDGKVFTTVKLLVTKPGFLTEEYLAGRRARYLHPVRMYMFISFVFFFVLFTFFPFSKSFNASTNNGIQTGKNHFHVYLPSQKNDTAETLQARQSSKSKAPTVAEFEAHQDSLPPDKRAGKFESAIAKQFLGIVDETNKDRKKVGKRVSEKFMHSLPQMFFVLLPIFAGLLAILYARQKKTYNFVAHSIFAVHYYCFVFLGWLASLFLRHIPFIGNIFMLLLFLSTYLYLFIAMQRFYKQSTIKTALKYVLFNSVFLVCISATIIIYLVISAAETI